MAPGLHNFNVRKFYVSQLVCILKYLRSKRVVHRDLKPANLLMNERWQLVLADFGTSKILKDIEMGHPLGLKKSVSTNNFNADKSKASPLLESVDDDELVGTE